jgi:hypothetical protein
MESTIESIGGKLDPSLSSVDPEAAKKPEESASADASKAKRRFPWSKKEVAITKVEGNFKKSRV